MLCLMLVYPLNVVRLGIRGGTTSPESWWFAVFSVPAKFAHLQGILKFNWHSWRRQATQLIEYKKL
jgi:hypothetical protein